MFTKLKQNIPYIEHIICVSLKDLRFATYVEIDFTALNEIALTKQYFYYSMTT